MSLATLWFFLLAILWAAWIATDGFDLGVGILYPFIGKTPEERTELIESIAPLWDGNEVWLITAAGATFAAFPSAYAALLSFMYILFALLLFSLILRGISLEFIYKSDNPSWLKAWGILFFAGSITAPFVFGLIFGNVFHGVGFDAGGLKAGGLSLINPYSVLTGTLMVFVCILHGGIWIGMKTQGNAGKRAGRTAMAAWFIVLALIVLFAAEAPAFTRMLENYKAEPVLFIIPAITVACLACIRVFFSKGRHLAAFLFSMAAILLFFMCAYAGLYPYLLPSSIDPAAGIGVCNSSSGGRTLIIMTVVAALLVPTVITCQAFVYRVFRVKG